MAILLWLGIAIATWTVWNGVSLYRNYSLAKASGLSVVIQPVCNMNPFLIIITKLNPWLAPALQKLPFDLGYWARFSYFGWPYDDARGSHNRLGPVFIICTPNYNEVVIGDPGAANYVLTRRKEFIKPELMYQPLKLFGENVDTAEGEVWKRHRRLTAPSLNDRVNDTVWAQGILHGRNALDSWLARGSQGTRTMCEDTADLALNVWMKAGFGISVGANNGQLESHHRWSYAHVLYKILANFVFLGVVPMHWLSYRFMPAKIRTLGDICDEFKLYLKEFSDREKSAVRQGKSNDGNLLASLIRASEAELRDGSRDNKHGTEMGLADDEVYGNMFVYSFAGFETTANTLAAAIAYLSGYPEWQEWLVEELQNVSQSYPDSEDWSFANIFPSMKRCLAIMYETLRLQAPANFIPKATVSDAQILAVGGKNFVLPARTNLLVNVCALHTDPESWGPDAFVWRPDRWIVKTADGREELLEPPRGSFVPWADGPRVCPGKKFAQVEFVAVMSTLFRGHMASPVPEMGDETLADARQRVLNMVADSGITGITHQIRHPGSVALRWEERKSVVR